MNYNNIIFVLSKKLTLLSTSLLLVSCANTNVASNVGISGELSNKVSKVDAPVHWSGSSITEAKGVANQHWLTHFDDPQLTALVTSAFKHNFKLQQLAFASDIAKQRLLNAGTQFWPDLSAKVTGNRGRQNQQQAVSNGTSAGLNLTYQVDLWGKLSAAEQQANLTWLAQQATLDQAKQQLAADVTNAWYHVVSAKALWQLSEQRAANIKQNLAIIDAGYHQGINSALDVYLSRNALNTALSNVAKQHDAVLASTRALENLLGQYPSGKLVVKTTQLPLITGSIPAGTPLAIIKRKPEIRASWYQLLAQDAGLAFAHKQRFPSFNFSASLTNSETSFAQLLSHANLGWSLLGSITAPLFQAGLLKHNEQIARLTLKQTEQHYLDTLYQAFTVVENALTSDASVQQQVSLQEKAKQNAQAAYKLSFEQYQHGLVSYTTVLDAQNRWYDARSSLIQLQSQLITNRINLYVALGGDF